jgi:hypothetical protein
MTGLSGNEEGPLALGVALRQRIGQMMAKLAT